MQYLLTLVFNLIILSPEPWFAEKEGGPVIDMGPYYITALVTLLGPVKSVTSRSKKVFEKEKLV